MTWSRGANATGHKFGRRSEQQATPMELLKLTRELTKAQGRGLETQEPALSRTRWPAVTEQASVRYPPYRAQASWDDLER